MRSHSTLLVTVLLVLINAQWTTAATPMKKPNTLFLFADDQRADTIAALGNPVTKTPNIDSLARSGFVFRNAYCLGGNVAAVCTPSRNSGPGIPQGQSDALVDLRDISPTVCDLVGASMPFGLDGKSVNPVLYIRDAGRRGYAIRTTHYALMNTLAGWQKQLGDTAPLTSATPREARFVPPTENK